MEIPSSSMIEDFLRGFGQDTQSLMEAYDSVDTDEDAFAEFAINMGYRWLGDPYNVWVHRDDPETEIEIAIYDYLMEHSGI